DIQKPRLHTPTKVSEDESQRDSASNPSVAEGKGANGSRAEKCIWQKNGDGTESIGTASLATLRRLGRRFHRLPGNRHFSALVIFLPIVFWSPFFVGSVFFCGKPSSSSCHDDIKA